MWVNALLFFVVGTVVGSFLNVVIYRLPRNESIAFPPSHCPKCNHKLAPWDLIPILSYLFLEGRCRYCGEPISWQYPVVETITGLLFAVASFLPLPEMIFFIIFVCFSIAISWIDLQTMLIPEVLILPLIAVLVLSRTYTYQWFILTGAFSLFLIHLIIHLIVPDGFGMGDVFYAAAVGLMLPPHLLLVWFVTTYALGTIVGLSLIGLNKMERKTPLPFAPIMFAGTLITYFFGSYIYNWYLTLFL